VNKNPYDVLGISPFSSKEEIRKAFKNKDTKCNPDLNPNGDAVLHEELVTAYNFLTRKTKSVSKMKLQVKSGSAIALGKLSRAISKTFKNITSRVKALTNNS